MGGDLVGAATGYVFADLTMFSNWWTSIPKPDHQGYYSTAKVCNQLGDYNVAVYITTQMMDAQSVASGIRVRRERAARKVEPPLFR